MKVFTTNWNGALSPTVSRPSEGRADRDTDGTGYITIRFYDYIKNKYSTSNSRWKTVKWNGIQRSYWWQSFSYSIWYCCCQLLILLLQLISIFALFMLYDESMKVKRFVLFLQIFAILWCFTEMGSLTLPCFSCDKVKWHRMQYELNWFNIMNSGQL